MDNLFQDAFPIARRSAEVYSARWSQALRAAGYDRQDLEGDCIYEVCRSLKHFNPSKSSLSTFVERVVASKAISFLRKSRSKKRTRVDEATAEGQLPIEVAIPLRVDVRRALGRLDHADQKVARMLLNWNPSEISKVLGISRQAVYRAMGRVRVALVGAGVEIYMGQPDRSRSPRVYSVRTSVRRAAQKCTSDDTNSRRKAGRILRSSASRSS